MNQGREVGVKALAVVQLRSEGKWVRVVDREMDYVLTYNRTGRVFRFLCGEMGVMAERNKK